MPTNILIDIYSDVICPWCYVGKRRLERALTLIGDELGARVTWRPFQLNPTMPAEGKDRTEYLEGKFGDLDAFKSLEDRVVEAGEVEGITFAFDKIGRTPNTFMAHRLIWYARQRGLQDAVVEALFKGYFEEGVEIGRAAPLAELAGHAGLDAEQFLESEKGVTEVKAEEAEGHRLGIRGVPYFVFDGVCAISGAQPPEQFVAALRAVALDGAAGKAGV
jgi:predicted DsbA family dithiol-disulfide isomerase